MTQRIIRDMDILIGVRMYTINKGLSEMKKFLDDNNIHLATPTKNSKQTVGEVLIDTLEALDKFLTEYRECKDTWQVTTA